MEADWIRIIRILKSAIIETNTSLVYLFMKLAFFVFIDLILYIDIIICFLFTCLLSYYRSCVQEPIIDLDFTYLCSQISKFSIFLRLCGEFSLKDIFFCLLEKQYIKPQSPREKSIFKNVV